MHGGQLAVLALTHAHATSHHGDIGKTIRDWGTLAATVIAAIGAASAAVIAARAYSQQTKDRHREHASKFSVWAEPVTVPAHQELVRTGWRALVHNSSDEPMYRVIVNFRDGRDPTKTVATGDPVIDVLPPGQTLTITGDRIPRRPDLTAVYAEAGFTDRAQRRWHRDWQGGLTENKHFTLDTTPPDEPGAEPG